MEAPKCRLCGDRHYGPCNVFAGMANTDNMANRDMANIGDPVSRKKAIETANKILRGAERERKPKKTYQYRDPDKRREYQRELMRKRRAR